MALLCIVCGFDRERVDSFTCGKPSCLAALSPAEREAEASRAVPFDNYVAPCSWCGHLTTDAVDIAGTWHPICERCSRGPDD